MIVAAPSSNYQAHITGATLAMKSNNKDAIRQELDNQVKNYSDFKASGNPAEAKEECANTSPRPRRVGDGVAPSRRSAPAGTARHRRSKR
ncbi:MAG: hypothetical protein U0235_21020 [Polyangiaceae bacterium]